MKKFCNIILLFCLTLFTGILTAQNLYESLGEEATVLTLSNGHYQEHFPNETFVDIGGVRLNTVTGKVVGLLDTETETDGFDPTVSTRFLSVDPIARDFPELTPYQFASNTPIKAIDLDGLEAGDIYQVQYHEGLVGGGVLSHNKISKDDVTDLHTNQAIGAMAGSVAGITLYSGGRAKPFLERLFWKAAIWGSQTQNQMLIGEAGAMAAAAMDPDPSAQYSTGAADELGNAIGQGVRYLFRGVSSKEYVSRTAEAVNVTFTSKKPLSFNFICHLQ